MQEDAHIIQQILLGNDTAIDELVHRYYDEIFRYIVRMGCSNEEAMDLTQEVFIIMIKSLATYKYGRKSLILVKLAVLFCICAFTILYFFIIAGTISYFLYGFDDWMLTTNSIDFIYLDMFLEGEWLVWQVLVFEYIYLLLSTFTFALSLFLVARFIRRSVFIMLTGGAVFLLVELLDKFVMSFVNQMKISEYINIMIRYSFNSLVNFELLDLFSFPQLFSGLIISMLILIIVNILIEGKTVND